MSRRTILHHDSVGCLRKWILWIYNKVTVFLVYPITRQILDSYKLKDFVDDNFKFEENGRKLFKLVEITVGKGEIARYEQFLLYPQCFQKACFPGASKGVIVWEWVKTSRKCINPSSNKPMFLRVCRTSILKTLWEMKKLLVTSNFPFIPIGVF